MFSYRRIPTIWFWMHNADLTYYMSDIIQAGMQFLSPFVCICAMHIRPSVFTLARGHTRSNSLLSSREISFPDSSDHTSRLINTGPCIHKKHPDRCCVQFHTHSGVPACTAKFTQKEPVCEETSRQAASPRSTPSCKQAGGRFGHAQTGLVWACERCRKRNLRPGQWSNLCLKCVHVCVGALPSSWVATVSGAELSPGPLALDATTRNVYLVSGTRFWMVTCISPGPLVFSTRSLWAKPQLWDMRSEIC